MAPGTGEPIRLRRGKAFHRRVQADWAATATGEVRPEKTVTRRSGRKGRVDVFVRSEEDIVALVEVKATDWDAMTPAAVRRNVRRQARQVWSYVETQLDLKKDVCPGIVFPRRPRVSGRLQLIESLFDEEALAVVWEDETREERKARA